MLHACLHFHLLPILSLLISSFVVSIIIIFFLASSPFLRRDLFIYLYYFVTLLYEVRPLDIRPHHMMQTSKMSTHKVKGLLKGLRYISQVFDDQEKKQEIQIGAPTDVKHVAHIGCDGTAEESLSWMRGFGTPSQCQSTSSNVSEAPSDGPEWVSEDSGQKVSRRDRQEKQKSRHRRHRSVENAPDPDSQTKSRQPRRNHTRGAEGRHLRDESLPEVPKRTRKKKPKDELGRDSSRSSKSNADEVSSQVSDAEK